MTPEERQASPCGVGGYKCRCCGPAPKARPKWRRMVRRRLAAITRKAVRAAHKEDHTDV